MITIVGAGSIGLSLGGRLARAGADVTFLTRRPEAARAIEAHGIHVSDPADVTGAPSFDQRVGVVVDPDALPPSHRDGIAVLCVRATETAALAPRLARALPRALFVCAQNDVDNEDQVASHASRVAGLVFRQTCTRRDERSVFALGRGRIVVGDHSGGCAGPLEAFALAAEAAGFDVGRSQEIARDKWLKLCVNLMSTPNALVRREDHDTQPFVEVKARLVEEARDALAAAGIVASSCDGRDRSLDDEIAYQRASLASGTSARHGPLYNAVWMALTHPGLGLEADRFHARIMALGDTWNVPTPVNRLAHAHLLRAVRDASGPESVTARSLLP